MSKKKLSNEDSLPLLQNLHLTESTEMERIQDDELEPEAITGLVPFDDEKNENQATELLVNRTDEERSLAEKVEAMIELKGFRDRVSFEEPRGKPKQEDKNVNVSKSLRNMFEHSNVERVHLGQPFFLQILDRTKLTKEGVDRPIIEEHRELFYAKKSKKDRVVFWDCSIRDVSSIRLDEEAFDVSIRFYLTWLATADDILSKTWDVENWKEWRSPSEPKNVQVANKKNVQVANKKNKELELVSTKLTTTSDYDWHDAAIRDLLGFDARKGIWVRSRYEFRGTVTEEFELHSFPFDCQDLKVIIRCDEDLVFAPLPAHSAFLNFNPQQSTLEDFTVVNIGAEFGKTEADRSRGERIKGEVTVVVKIQRNWTSTLHIIFGVIILTLLSLVVFSLDPNPKQGDLKDRANYLVTLILADITFQQSMKNRLPSTPYLTALDRFIWASFLFKTLVLLWVGIPFYPLFGRSSMGDNQTENERAAWIFLIGFLMYVVAAIIYFVILNMQEKRKNYSSSKELQVRYGIEDDPVCQARLSNWIALLLRDEKQNRFSQYGVKQNLANSIENIRELVEFDEKERKRNLTFRINNFVLFICCVIAFSITFAVNAAVHYKFSGQIIVIECTNTLVYLAWIAYELMPIGGGCGEYNENDGSNKKNKKNPQYLFHNKLIQMTALFGACVYAVVDSGRLREGFNRAFVMYVVLIVWCGMRVMYNVWYLFRNRKDEATKRVAKYRMVWVSVYNDLYQEQAKQRRRRRNSSLQYDRQNDDDKQLCLSKSRKRFAFVFKHFFFGYLQGFRLLILLLPVFFVESAASMNSEIPTLGVVWDVGGGLVILGGAVLWLFSVVKYETGYAWSVDVVQPEETKKTKIERLQTMDRARDSDTSMATSSVELTAEMDEQQEQLSKKIDGAACNPFKYVRFPVQLSWVIVWIGFWVVSLVVYSHSDFALATLLCPITAAIWDLFIVVPLLDGIYDEYYGNQDAYRRYRANIAPLFPINLFLRQQTTLVIKRE